MSTVPKTATDLDALMDVLADPTRRQAVQHLSERPMRAGELAEAIAVSAPVMSRHLRILLDVGVVTDERGRTDARVRIFRLRPEAIVPLRAWIDQVAAQWDEQLQSFKTHIESSHEPEPLEPS